MRRISEERTRKEMIDPRLEKAGWYLSAVTHNRHIPCADSRLSSLTRERRCFKCFWLNLLKGL